MPRRPRWRFGAALLLLLTCLPIAHARAEPGPYAEIDAYVRQRMKETKTPGLAYAVVGPDGPVHRRAWGTDGRGDRVTAETPFLWGSVAKPVTATAVMTLVQSGRLRLDDRVVDHLPGFRFGGPAHASKVTIRHLLEHTAGIPAPVTPRLTDCHGSGCPRPARRLAALDDVTPLGPPGTTYAYTSVDYLVLTAVVESVTGRPLADVLRRNVFTPAGMDGAIADTATARRRGLAPGHQLLWGLPAATADGFDEHGAGYGYVGGGIDDLAAFASLQLRSGAPVLTPESARLMRREGRLSPGGDGTGYGLGWRIGGLDAPLDDAVWHTGGVPGYSAMLFLLPRRNLALVLHQNLYGPLQDGAIMQVGFGAARLLAGGGRPAESPSASVHHLTVWGLTAVAVALLVAAARTALLLRRPSTATARGRLAAVTAVWVTAGALPAAAMAARAGMLRPMLIWVPDAFAAVCAAAVGGAATAVLRLALAVRAVRTGRPPASRPATPRQKATG